MTPKRRLPTSPGEILLEEFLRPLRLTQVAFARHLGVPVRRINEIVRGKRAVSPETAQLSQKSSSAIDRAKYSLRARKKSPSSTRTVLQSFACSVLKCSSGILRFEYLSVSSSQNSAGCDRRKARPSPCI